MDYDNEKVRNITDEMRKHEAGSAAEAFYSPEAWRELCDRIDAANEREVDDALNAGAIIEVTRQNSIPRSCAAPTCSIVVTPSDSDYSNEPHYKCSVCGAFIPVYERDPNDYGLVKAAAKYCPNCGRMVESCDRRLYSPPTLCPPNVNGKRQSVDDLWDDSDKPRYPRPWTVWADDMKRHVQIRDAQDMEVVCISDVIRSRAIDDAQMIVDAIHERDRMRTVINSLRKRIAAVKESWRSNSGNVEELRNALLAANTLFSHINFEDELDDMAAPVVAQVHSAIAARPRNCDRSKNDAEVAWGIEHGRTWNTEEDELATWLFSLMSEEEWPGKPVEVPKKEESPDAKAVYLILRDFHDEHYHLADQDELTQKLISAYYAEFVVNPEANQNGNVAKLRSALEDTNGLIKHFLEHDELFRDALALHVKENDEALAAPARLCDKYHDQSDAIRIICERLRLIEGTMGWLMALRIVTVLFSIVEGGVGCK